MYMMYLGSGSSIDSSLKFFPGCFLEICIPSVYKGFIMNRVLNIVKMGHYASKWNTTSKIIVYFTLYPEKIKQQNPNDSVGI